MKRILSIVLSVLMLFSVATVFAGCSQDKGYTKEGRLVLKVGDTSEECFKELAARFTAETGTEVLVRTYTGLSDSGNLTLDGPFGKGQDIYLQGVGGDLGAAAQQGLFIEIPEEKLKIDTLIESAQHIYNYNGKNYGVALGMETYGIIYNKDLIASIPENWEDFEAEVLKINKFEGGPRNHVYGFLMDTTNPYFTNAFVEAFGGYIFYKNQDNTWDPTKLGINTPETIKAYEFLYDMMYTDKGGKTMMYSKQTFDFNSMTSKFKNKQVAAILDGPWSVPTYRSMGIDVGVANIPAIKMADGSHKNPITFSGAYGLAISSFSLNKDLSVDFLNFCLRPDNAILYTRATGRMPSVKACYDLDEVKNDETITGLQKQISFSMPQPNINEMEVIWGPLLAAGSGVFIEKKPIASLLEITQKKIEESLSALKK